MLKRNPSAHQCANCNLGHQTWFSRCKEWKVQIEKAWLVYIIRPRRFALLASNGQKDVCLSSPPSFMFSQSSQASRSPPASQISQGGLQTLIAAVAEPWQVVVKRHRMSSRAMSKEKLIVSVTGTLESIPCKCALVEETPTFSQVFRGPGRLSSRLQSTEEDQNIVEFFQTQSSKL